MADHGTDLTDARFDRLAVDLRKTYVEAQKDLSKKMEGFVKRYQQEDQRKRDQLASGKITEQGYRNWKQRQVFTGKLWKEKVDQMTSRLFHANEEAMAMVREGQLDVFADNANFVEYCTAKDFGFAVSFDVYDKSAVDRLLKEDRDLLPVKKVDPDKDEAWNRKMVTNCVTQGIIQGESIPKIAKRIAEVVPGRNMSDMTRYARTAMTSAQNAGRIDAMHNAQDKGIRLMKVWIATIDSRTRDAHLDLDGAEAEVDDPFESELGEIMYPGDPEAEADNIWNCRCTLGWYYPDYPSEDSMTYEEEWDEEELEEYEEWQDEMPTLFSEGKFAGGEDDFIIDGLPTLEGVEPIEFGELEEPLSMEEIIDKVGQYDPTNGSCASAALAYIGNEFGYDIEDFKGGKSSEFFASNIVIEQMAGLQGVKSEVIKSTNEFEAAKQLIERMKSDKLYALSAGAHFAIVFKDADGENKYIDLQEYWGRSGVFRLDDTALDYRFFCSREHKDFFGHVGETSSILIDVESLRGNEDFMGMLQYVNTKRQE